MGEVTKIPEPTQQKLKKAKARIRRVGIYARVSTNRQAQLHSMAAQVSELTRFVSNRPEWKLTDIYLDFDSASGTKMRSEFYRMIDDAKNRKVDVIITKSIQRFGRNTVENVETMRTLVESGVVVYFQIEGNIPVYVGPIDTFHQTFDLIQAHDYVGLNNERLCSLFRIIAEYL